MWFFIVVLLVDVVMKCVLLGRLLMMGICVVVLGLVLVIVIV